MPMPPYIYFRHSTCYMVNDLLVVNQEKPYEKDSSCCNLLVSPFHGARRLCTIDGARSNTWNGRHHNAWRWPHSSRRSSCARGKGRSHQRMECQGQDHRSEENTYELQSLMSTPYAVFCLQKK